VHQCVWQYVLLLFRVENANPRSSKREKLTEVLLHSRLTVISGFSPMQLKIQPNRESIDLKIIICCNLHTGHTTTAEKEQSSKILLLSYAYSPSGSQNQIFKSTEQHRVNGSHFRSIEIGENYHLICPIRLGEC
jgi:hypothetical protein